MSDQENVLYETARSIWDPIHDAGRLRAAATAWTTLAGVLRQTDSAVVDLGDQARPVWTGAAADGYQRWTSKMHRALSGSADQCEQVAATLLQIAEKIDAANEQIHGLYESIAAIAVVGVLATVITFGVSDAAAAAAVAAATYEADGVIAAVSAFLAEALPVLEELAIEFGSRWAVGFSVNVGFKELGKIVEGKPFDWNVRDVTSAINGATGFAALTGEAAETVAGRFFGGALGRSLDDITDGKRPGLDAVTSGAFSAAIGTVLSAGAERPTSMTGEGASALEEQLATKAPDAGLITPETTILGPDGVPIGSPGSAFAADGTPLILGPDEVPLGSPGSAYGADGTARLLGPNGEPLSSTAPPLEPPTATAPSSAESLDHMLGRALIDIPTDAMSNSLTNQLMTSVKGPPVHVDVPTAPTLSPTPVGVP